MPKPDLSQGEFFSPEETQAGSLPPGLSSLDAQPIHTKHKAELVAEYLRLFQQITKHGSYVDGFAGPQAPEAPETWAAKRVLELNPLWLRHFFLYDNDAEKVARLEVLRAEHPDRDIVVRHSDFNTAVDGLLASGRIGENEATFCLLDQRTFECHWETVRKLALHKRERKVELFYFLAHWWLDRAVAATVDTPVLDRWWGGQEWRPFIAQARGDRPMLFADRFRHELGYTFVNPFSIYDAIAGGRAMYYMIHASDHQEAPKFMARAYQAVVNRPQLPPEPSLFEV